MGDGMTHTKEDKPWSAPSSDKIGVWPNFAAAPIFEDAIEGWEDPRLPDFNLIWTIARKHGYAVGLHGSMRRDVDLIAAPWVDWAADPLHLIEHLCAALNARVVSGPEQKPYGRIAWNLQIDGWVKIIDISVVGKLEA